MVARKEIKLQEFDTAADWFMLNSTQRIKDIRKYPHEHAAADLFVAFYPHIQSQGGRWAYEPAVLSDRADRGLMLFDKVFYFEIDRGTEAPREVAAKLNNYARYAEERGKQFYVVFSILGGKKTPQARGLELLPLLAAQKRASQFLLARHESLVSDPLGPVLYSPANELYSIKSVT